MSNAFVSGLSAGSGLVDSARRRKEEALAGEHRRSIESASNTRTQELHDLNVREARRVLDEMDRQAVGVGLRVTPPAGSSLESAPKRTVSPMFSDDVSSPPAWRQAAMGIDNLFGGGRVTELADYWRD